MQCPKVYHPECYFPEAEKDQSLTVPGSNFQIACMWHKCSDCGNKIGVTSSTLYRCQVIFFKDMIAIYTYKKHSHQCK